MSPSSTTTTTIIRYKKWLWLAAAFVCLGLLKIFLTLQFVVQNGIKIIDVECPDIHQGCLLPDNMQIHTATAPRHAERFKLILTRAQPDNAPPPIINLTMKDMEMPPARYTLHPSEHPNIWVGDIILPICSSGRSDWIAALEIGNVHYHIPFMAESGN